MPYKILHIPTGTYLQTKCFLTTNKTKYQSANFNSVQDAQRVIKKFIAGKTGLDYITQERLERFSAPLLLYLIQHDEVEYCESEFEVVRYYNV